MAGRPPSINYKDVFELRRQGLTMKKIAERLNVSKCSVFRILKHCSEDKKPTTLVKQERAKEVIDYILQNGGHIRKAINKLNVFISEGTVRRLAKKMKIKLTDYYYYKREMPNWIIDSIGTFKNKDNRISVIATCRHCGNEQSVTVQSLRCLFGPLCTCCDTRATVDTLARMNMNVLLD